MEWILGNILTIISMLFVVIGGIFGFIQWNNSIKIKRAEFINQIIDRLRFDDDVVRTNMITIGTMLIFIILKIWSLK